VTVDLVVFDDPFFDRKVQERVGAAITKAAQKP
jgi:hypothetical protein